MDDMMKATRQRIHFSVMPVGDQLGFHYTLMEINRLPTFVARQTVVRVDDPKAIDSVVEPFRSDAIREAELHGGIASVVFGEDLVIVFRDGTRFNTNRTLS